MEWIQFQDVYAKGGLSRNSSAARPCFSRWSSAWFIAVRFIPHYISSLLTRIQVYVLYNCNRRVVVFLVGLVVGEAASVITFGLMSIPETDFVGVCLSLSPPLTSAYHMYVCYLDFLTSRSWSCICVLGLWRLPSKYFYGRLPYGNVDAKRYPFCRSSFGMALGFLLPCRVRMSDSLHIFTIWHL